MFAELTNRHDSKAADSKLRNGICPQIGPRFEKVKTKFPEELHHVLDKVAHSSPAFCCFRKLGSDVVGSIYSLACAERVKSQPASAILRIIFEKLLCQCVKFFPWSAVYLLPTSIPNSDYVSINCKPYTSYRPVTIWSLPCGKSRTSKR